MTGRPDGQVVPLATPICVVVAHDVSFAPEAGKRIEALQWHPVDEPLADRALAFDHGRLIAWAVEVTRAEVEALTLPRGYLPEEFTLTELQSLCEKLLGRTLNKASFRRKLEDRALVEAVAGKLVASGAHRPAQVYRMAGDGRSDG